MVINIIGGLGNQMFQYAFGYAMAKKNNEELKLDISGFDTYDLHDFGLKLYNIKKNQILKSNIKYKFLLSVIGYRNTVFLSKVFRKLYISTLKITKLYYQEKKTFTFDENVFYARTGSYFSGYWQNEKYFKDCRKDLLDIFQLKKIHLKTKVYKNKIIKNESVSLHVRRGDYLNINEVCDIEYYHKAILLFRGEHVHFFIFSDDIEWVKNNLNFIDHKTIIELEKDIPDHEEMYLMSLCKHNIISNSSFSWWGAWLNKNDKKRVVAPKKWLTNKDCQNDAQGIYCEGWTKI